MEITVRLDGRLAVDDVKTIVTGQKEQSVSANEELIQDFLAWYEGKNKAPNVG